MIDQKREWTQYLTQGFRSIDNPSIEFPLRQMSSEVEKALRVLNGTYCGGVCARTKLGCQQGLQPDSINVPIMYDLLFRHDEETPKLQTVPA